jgi:general secretion pathway protein G
MGIIEIELSRLRLSPTMQQSRLSPLLPIFSQEDVRLALLLLRAQALRRHGRRLWRIFVGALVVSFIPTCALVCVGSRTHACGSERSIASNQAFEIEKSLELFKLINASYPTTAQGLHVLTSPPKGVPLLERVPKDPWGNRYGYVYPGLRNPSKFDIHSVGPDGRPYTSDDVGNWNDDNW